MASKLHFRNALLLLCLVLSITSASCAKICPAGYTRAKGECRLPTENEPCQVNVGCRKVAGLRLKCRATKGQKRAKCVKHRPRSKKTAKGSKSRCKHPERQFSERSLKYASRSAQIQLGDFCRHAGNANCGHGLICTAGRCALANGPGSLCKGSCANGYTCAKDSYVHRCYKLLDRNEVCSGVHSFSKCNAGLTCGQSGRCGSEGRSLGQACGGDDGKPCEHGLSCRNKDGDARDKDDEGVCMSSVSFDEPCDPSKYTFCSSTLDHIASRGASGRIGHIGDTCGADTHVICDPGDDCEGAPALTCKATRSTSHSTRSVCVNDHLDLGEPCPVSVKGERIFAFCKEGLKCDYNALGNPDPTKRSGCIKEVDLGHSCNFDKFVRCRYGLHCVSGQCEYKPFVVES